MAVSSNGPLLKLCVRVKDKEVKVEHNFRLHVNDLTLSWIEYFKKHYKLLYNLVAPAVTEFVLVDKRKLEKKKSWTMDSSMKHFINSFKRNQSTYTAILQEKGKIRRSPRLASATGVDNKQSPSTSKTPGKQMENKRIDNLRSIMMPPPSHPPVPVTSSIGGNASSSGFGRRVTIPIPDADAVSWATTASSQESQDDLVKLGIENREIKKDIMRKIELLATNTDMLKIQREVHQLYGNDGAWARFARRAPVLAHFIQNVFKA